MMMPSRTMILALLWALAAMPAAAYEYNTVFVGGRPANDPLGPQLGPGIDWGITSQSRWTMNAVGQIVFQRDLAGAPADADTTLWRWTNGTKELLGREGSQVPVMASGILFHSFADFAEVPIADDGTVMFSGLLRGAGVNPGNNESYMLAHPDGTFSVVVREGDRAAGFSPSTIYQPALQLENPIFQSPRLSHDGRMLVGAQIVGPGVTSDNYRLLYAGTAAAPGNLELIARADDPAPGFPSGTVLGLQLGRRIASAGPMVILTDVVNPDSSTTYAAYRFDSGTFTLLATDQSSTGIPGRIFTSPLAAFESAQINSTGDITFTGRIDPAPRDEALFRARAGSGHGVFDVLAGPGLPAPGTGVNFGLSPGFTVHHVLTESGAIAFMFDLAGTGVTSANDRGLWIADAAGARLAIREGVAAGPLTGVNLGTITHFTFNDNQNLVFVSDLTGNVTTSNDRALWLLRPNGNLELLLREGDLFDVDPSDNIDNRTISNLTLSGFQSSSDPPLSAYGAFNDSDQLAFSLRFTDGHAGLFVTNLSSVPEPAPVVLLCLGAVSSLGLQRHRRPRDL